MSGDGPPGHPPGKAGETGPPGAPGGGARRGWRRPTAITLVILGGVTAVGLMTCEGSDARCERLRAERHPDAEAACAETTRTSSSSAGSSYAGSGSSGSHGGGGDASAPVSARGGFGGTAHGFSGGG